MRKALGRGLNALISAQPTADAQSQAHATLNVPLSKIRPNHLQPRRQFDPEKLAELSSSIREHGLAQPIVVSYDQGSDSYEIIAGERRWRASELAGLTEINVVIRTPRDDQQRLALALVENLQREDLNPIEEALGYLRLIKEFHISQTDLGRTVGKAKSTVSNTLRLLELPEDMQKALGGGAISEAHGRALLSVSNALERKRLFELILEQNLSVRETVELARQIESGGTLLEEETARLPKPERPADLIALETELQQKLGTKVEIKTRKDPKRGSITLHFFSLDDLDKLLKILKN
ncbi:MAG: ParB/RepB/Spo0J family partition protein [Elusimicrobia bacterium]|nr:ParB/RepB/Spo0J family partition protein [Elusimicrobiota bacterium]MDE2424391.1 ParB/RepB/Spo0J family partition protein [Elusimicrobiota bacterium]